MSQIKDISLAPAGHQKIDWVRRNMPLLRSLEEEFAQSRPFQNLRVALSIHLEAKTAYLCQVLAAGGAEMWITGSNPLSTQDDVAAALAESGLNVFAWYNATDKEYDAHIRAVLEAGPHIIIDDGGDLVTVMHEEFPQLCAQVIGGCEETTTGILRLKAMAERGALAFPMVKVNDADCKHLFDNRYGTGQSVFDGIDRTTNLIIAGKTVVVAGYGWCGKGVAMRAKGLGARVTVTEINPWRAMEAVMDGFQVKTMDEAAKYGEFFVTVTGCSDVITDRHFEVMRHNAFLANAGHFDVEVSEKALRKMATKVENRRNFIDGYHMKDGRILNLLAEGKLVNIVAGNGHPADIMDMSFALQAMGCKYIAENGKNLEPKLYFIPEDVDRQISLMKCAAMGLGLDALTPEQEEYYYGTGE